MHAVLAPRFDLVEVAVVCIGGQLFTAPSRSGARLALLPRRRCSPPTLELVQPTIDFHECLDQVTNELVHVKATLRHAGVAQALGDVLKRWAHDELLPLLPDLLLAA